jgi:hypothetical protein
LYADVTHIKISNKLTPSINYFYSDSALVDAALYQMDVPALSYIYAAYGKSDLISNGKE